VALLHFTLIVVQQMFSAAKCLFLSAFSVIVIVVEIFLQYHIKCHNIMTFNVVVCSMYSCRLCCVYMIYLLSYTQWHSQTSVSGGAQLPFFPLFPLSPSFLLSFFPQHSGLLPAPTCYELVVYALNLLRICYGETGVMDFVLTTVCSQTLPHHVV